MKSNGWMFDICCVQPACDGHMGPRDATVPRQERAAPSSPSGSQRLGRQSLLPVREGQVVPVDRRWGSGRLTEPRHPACLHHQRGAG